MKIIEIQGGGFHPGIPASMAGGNCRVKLDDAEQVVEVVPLGSLFSDEQKDSAQEETQRESEASAKSRKASQS